MNIAAGRPTWPLAVSSALLLGGFVALLSVDVVHGTLRDSHVPTTIACFAAAFGGFLMAVWSNERSTIPWRWVWIVALTIRLLLVFTTPTLSDDVYRYLWEGHLVSQGVSPYDAPILDPSLDQYEIPARQLANTPTFASPYLPTAHLVFGAAAVVLPSEPWVMQLIMVSLELAAAAMLAALLGVVGLGRERIVLWLWNPLVVVEVAHGAHLDAITVAGALAAIILALHPRFSGRMVAVHGSPILLALATLTRPIPLLLIPVFFSLWSGRQRMLFAVALVVGITPFIVISGLGLTGDERVGVFGSAREYGESFRFNSAVYQSLEGWIATLGLDDRGWIQPAAFTRFLVASALGVVLVAVWRRARTAVGPLELLRLASIPLATYVLLAPVMHPWYVLLPLALLVFQSPGEDESGSRWLLLTPWAWMCGAIVLSYLTYEDPLAFAELAWVRRVVWWPVIGLLVAALLGGWWRPRRVRPSQ